ncbi:hypothetical protein ACIA6D_42980 [Streptomyces cacaoi]|uniref:hypothetical protein n=1 Tax=Streptomyces cacaoi TaxID=1898 RepID=UPI003748B2E4
MRTTATPDRFTTLPDEHALASTVAALEEHGFSVHDRADRTPTGQERAVRIPVLPLTSSHLHALTTEAEAAAPGPASTAVADGVYPYRPPVVDPQ